MVFTPTRQHKSLLGLWGDHCQHDLGFSSAKVTSSMWLCFLALAHQALLPYLGGKDLCSQNVKLSKCWGTSIFSPCRKPFSGQQCELWVLLNFSFSHQSVPGVGKFSPGQLKMRVCGKWHCFDCCDFAAMGQSCAWQWPTAAPEGSCPCHGERLSRRQFNKD